MRILLAILLLCFHVSEAYVATQLDLLMGSYTLRVLYDPTKPPPSKVLHVATEGSVLYAVAVDKGISDKVVCRKVVTKQIVVSPRGCDARTPTEAVVDHFCEFGGDLALQSARELTKQQWSLRADSPQCIDKSTCFGPVYATSERWTPDKTITDLDLLMSNNGVFVVSGSGPAGEIPMITSIPIKMPRVLASSDRCVGFTDAEFELTAKDAYEFAYVNATYTYGSTTDVTRRLRLERSNPGTFRVVLGYKGGSKGYYDDKYISVYEYSGIESVLEAGDVPMTLYNQPTYAPTLVPTNAPNWTPSPTRAPTATSSPSSLAPTTLSPTSAPTIAPSKAPTTTSRPTSAPVVTLGPTSQSPTTSTPTQAPATSCFLTVTLESLVGSLQLIEPVAPNDLTYYLDHRGSYVTRECFIRRGALDQFGNLVHPNCPRNALCGGRARFRAPGPFGQRYRVEPHFRYKDFEWSCTRFWPRSATFTGLRGSQANRDAPDLLACNAPFPYPQRIKDKDYDIYEKLRQCKMLGGYGALESVDYCTMDVVTTKCRKGWFFFDEFCYYRPDPDKDGEYRVRQDDADSACSALHPKAKAAVGIDEYTESWLQTNFIFQNIASCGTDPVRALVTGTRCKCYDCDVTKFDNDNETIAEGVVTECGCEKPVFPLCYYRMKDDYLAWTDESYHPATLEILKNGQCADGDGGNCMGNERYGKELECECFPGSTGQYCERRTCIVNASTILGDGLLLKFAQLCEKHGFCDEGQVDTCACAQGYGPPSTFGSDSFNDFPCGLPTTLVPRDPEGGFIVDGVMYTEPYGVCNGASAGSGSCDPTTKMCKCTCSVRKNMDPDGEPFEPAYDGVTCSARTPMLPANGFQNNDGIVERLCNGRGTACPSGERLNEKRLDGTYLVTVDSDKCRGKPDGCVCDNGFTGHACTVPIPYDDAARKPTFFDYSAYVPIRGGRNPVMNVVIKPERAYAGAVPTCDVLQVYVSDTALKSDTYCTKTDDEYRWWCNGVYGSYVILKTAEEKPSCSVEVYTENYAPCGNYTNPYMARLYANSVYRDWNRTDEFQSLQWAKHGGTTTECGCDENHTGKLCRNRISGKRLNERGETVNHVCGENTLPPRGKPTDDGCECNFIAGFDFSGSEGCACATIQGLGQCGGVGKCFAPQMPLGWCEVDLLWESEDPMSTPFTEVAPPDSVRKFTYMVTQRSVFEFEGESWLVNEGQTFEIEAAVSNISICHDNSRYPLNITHECGQPPNIVGPVRAIANVTVVEFAYDTYVGNYSATCDPAFSCPTLVYCFPGSTVTCLIVNEWMEDENEAKVLASKRYIGSRATCAYAMPTTTQDQKEFPYGVFPTCSDPVYRWLDEALVGAGYVSERQCTGFRHHDNVKGQIFGVFDNVIPGLNFRLQNWTDAHYAFLSSLMNDQKCVDPVTGKPLPDAMNDAVMDAYAISLVSLGAEDDVQLGEYGSGASLTTEWSDSIPTQDVDAWWGNYYWHLGTALPFGPTTRWGGWMYLPKGQGEVRKVTLRNGDPSKTLTAFAIVGPKGEVCAAHLHAFEPNDTYTVDCGSSFEVEPLPLSLRRLWDMNRTNETSGLISWPSPYVLLYSTDAGPVSWRESDVGYTSRTVSYTDRWRSISSSIIGKRTFPHNAPYVTSCAKQGGVLAPYETTDQDKQHLRDVYTTHLAPARCTHDWMCKRFSKDGTNYRCIPDDSVPASCWANGDPNQCEALVGFEGGCEFSQIRELMDPEFHGSKCLGGYEATSQSVVGYETLALPRLLAAGWTGDYVLYDATEWPNDEAWAQCVFPSDVSTGRPTLACGGARGRLIRDVYTVQRNLTIYDSNKYKRCASVVLKSTGEELAAHENELELDMHSFGNYRVNVLFGGKVFIDGELASTDDVECVERTYSATHRVLTVVNNGNEALISKQRDFWTNFILV